MKDHRRISRDVEDAIKAKGIDVATAWSGDNLIIYVPNDAYRESDKRNFLNGFTGALDAVGFSYSRMAK